MQSDEDGKTMDRLRAMADVLCPKFKLTYRMIEAERDGVNGHYGICYEDGEIRIRVRDRMDHGDDSDEGDDSDDRSGSDDDDSDDDDSDDRSGHDDDDNSGPGSSDEDDDDDNSGPGSGDDDDDDDGDDDD